MSTFPFLIDLCESRLIASRNLLKQWKTTKLAELCYLYFIALRILLADHTAKKWAHDYCKNAGEPNDFLKWRTDGNDLYVMLYALISDDSEANDSNSRLDISPSIIRHWLRHDAEEHTRRLFMRLDGMFHIGSSSMKAMRRTVLDWDDVDKRERRELVNKLIQWIHERAPSNSEILPKLKSMYSDMKESASSGATGSASIATVIGGLGAGFDPAGDRGIYGTKKPMMIRRGKLIGRKLVS